MFKRLVHRLRYRFDSAYRQREKDASFRAALAMQLVIQQEQQEIAQDQLRLQQLIASGDPVAIAQEQLRITQEQYRVQLAQYEQAQEQFAAANNSASITALEATISALRARLAVAR